MLELKHISYRVSTPDGEQDILKDISITIPDEKLVVFTGPNGGGKTTMAKVIMGLVEPTSGQILYNGQDITHLSITERARLGISYGFQQPPRFKGITVHDLLTSGGGQGKAHQGPVLPVPDPGGPVRQRLSGAGGGCIPLRRRGQAHRDRHHSGPAGPAS